MLRRLFRKKTFSDLCRDADRLFEDEHFGRAKLLYERAVAASDIPSTERSRIEARISTCSNAIARAHLVEADRLLHDGQLALARDELEQAAMVAQAPELQTTVQTQLDHLERRSQVTAVPVEEASAEVDDETQYLALGGQWGDDQATEYARYGDRFKHALLRLHDQHVEAATRELEALLAENHRDAHYLWYEVGQARLANGDPQGAVEALSTFIRQLEPSAGGHTRLTAHFVLADIAAQRDDLEGALNCYSDALDALPKDPRPYVALGRFMRLHDMVEEALDVLQSGHSVLGENQPHPQLWSELGETYAALGHDAEAKRWLEQALAHFTTRHHFDLPPPATLCLAQLYERQGNLGRAADLLKLLAEGSDRHNLLHYHLEVSRLLLQLKATDEAQRFLRRAADLPRPSDDPSLEARLTELQARAQTA